MTPDDVVRIQLGDTYLLPSKDGRVDLQSSVVQQLMRRGDFWLGQVEQPEDALPPHPIEGPLRWRQPRTNPAPDGYWEPS